MESEKNCPKILMFPWLAHGHIFPYLELAKTILKKQSFHIYLCSTPINSTSINTFIKHNSLHNSLQLVELHLDSSPQLPPHYHSPKNLPSHLVFELIKAFQTSHVSFSGIVAALKPDLVVYDLFQPWAAKIASRNAIPAVHFATFGASVLSFIHSRQKQSSDDFPFSAPLHLEDYEVQNVDNLIKFLNASIFDADPDFYLGNFKQSCDIVLVKTNQRLEAKYIDYVSASCHKKVVPVGVLVGDHNRITPEKDSEIMRWLSKKDLKSTVYISFGSEYFLSKQEFEQVAKGLELCGVNFIWVIRFHCEDKGASLEEALPQGFVERVSDRGLFVVGWAPQAEILAHENTAAFVSHCGWSSLMESLFFGVPVIGMPMQFDQPVNVKMAVEAGFCVEVGRDENGVFGGEGIAKGVNEVFEEKRGEELRRRAKEWGEMMRRDEEEDVYGVADHLLMVIKNYMQHK